MHVEHTNVVSIMHSWLSNLSCNIYQFNPNKRRIQREDHRKQQQQKVFISLPACMPSPNSIIRHSFYKKSPSAHAPLVRRMSLQTSLSSHTFLQYLKVNRLSRINRQFSPPLFRKFITCRITWSELSSNMCYGYSIVFSHANLRPFPTP